MDELNSPVLLILLLVVVCDISVNFSTAGDSLTPDHSIADADGQTLVSSGGSFRLGFFTPVGGSNRYIGIWFNNIPIQTPVWVANRKRPITGSAGVLNLSTDGTLAIYDRAGGDVLWSTGTSGLTSPLLRLLNSGNLVLQASGGRSTAWQSFDCPSDTLIPGMKLGWDLRTHLDRNLTSWEATSDPSPGGFSLAIVLQESPELYLLNGSGKVARTWPWDGQLLGGAALMKWNTVFNFGFVSNEDEVYYAYENVNKSLVTRLVVTDFGLLQQQVWLGREWTVYWSGPRDQCDHYAQCGPFGVCNSASAPLCTCLRGFVPKSPEEWSLRDGSHGCVRRVALGCPAGVDDFVKVAGVKLPDTSNAKTMSTLDGMNCRDWCLDNCSCRGYALPAGERQCIAWYGDLIDTMDRSLGGGDDLYVRLAASEMIRETRRKRRFMLISVILSSSVVLILSTLGYFVLTRRCRPKGMREVSDEQLMFELDMRIAIKPGERIERRMEFSLFNFSDIVGATNNFSDANKLGQGGYGPVYKGHLAGGQEIAVKRLASRSSQGGAEFKNEILLIAKLQHINLVKLLGCCIQGEEKILIYEYMPNKSLDFFLFDPARGTQLDWETRLHIVQGIAQGVLYLHKHSRLRIIHRDLKVSNILLDADMNAKISDFGMARIFSFNESEANTKRVVGTYGYMSPEYASEGLFSIKSDVFSFGVMLLEIISGRRNIGFHQNENFTNLLGYAWLLWNEHKWTELVDSSLSGTYPTNEVCRCIYVALMCVQESALDRPTMSDVVSMLGSDGSYSPAPKKPAFFIVRVEEEEDLQICSQNDLTLSVTDGR